MSEIDDLEPYVIEWWPLRGGIALWPDEKSDPVRGGVKVSDGEVICIFRGFAPDDEGAFTMVSGGIEDMAQLHAVLGEAIRRARKNVDEEQQ
jgi:hypothetical protein